MFKRKCYQIALVLAVLLLSSCAVTPSSTPPASTTPTIAVIANTEAANKVVIKDPVLEQAIRFAISKTSGELTRDDVNSIKELRVYGINENMIKSLDGIEQLTNLELLDIESAGLKDIGPLASLKHLTSLTLKDNSISDIEPVKELKSLQTLDLSLNLVENIQPLAGLANLTTLKLDLNKVTDLSPLKNLVLLKNLSLTNNMVSDISVLGAMKDLQELSVSANYKIKDFSVLSGLQNIEKISVDFMNRKDIDILKSYQKLIWVDFFGYILSTDPQAANAKIDLSKYYEMMDTADHLLDSVIKPGMSDYEKEFVIFDNIEDNLHYGYHADKERTDYSAYGALAHKYCECQGFSYTLCLLMNKAGVDCISITEKGHYWNIIKLDDDYYEVDASRTIEQHVKYSFFNMNNTQLDMTWDSKGYYPVCNGTKYAYKPE